MTSGFRTTTLGLLTSMLLASCGAETGSPNDDDRNRSAGDIKALELPEGTCSLSDTDDEPPVTGANAGAWKAYWTASSTTWYLFCGRPTDSWNASFRWSGAPVAGAYPIAGGSLDASPRASFTRAGTDVLDATGTIDIDEVNGPEYVGSFDVSGQDGSGTTIRLRGLFRATRP